MFRLNLVWPLSITELVSEITQLQSGWSCAGTLHVPAKLVQDQAVPGLALLG